MDQDDLIILDGSTKRHVLLQQGLEEISSSNNRSKTASEKMARIPARALHHVRIMTLLKNKKKIKLKLL